MSTKLYDAWRMPVMPMSKFQKWLDELRAAFKPMADEKILKEIARRAIYNYDMQCVFPNSEQVKELKQGLVSNWAEVLSDYKKVKKTGERDILVDAECEIIFHFKGRYIYMVMFSEMREYKDYLESLPGVEYYGYWNNTDRPDNLSQREWRRREKTWDSIFRSSFFFKGGVTWMLLGEFDIAMPNKGKIEPYFTPWEKRVSAMVSDAVFKQYPEEITSRNVFDALKWVKKDPEAQQLKAEYKPKIEALMKKDLTFEDLNNT